jgi:hypothetical protein
MLLCDILHRCSVTLSTAALQIVNSGSLHSGTINLMAYFYMVLS